MCAPTAASHLIGSVSGASSRPFTLTEVWAKILSRQLINTTKSDNGFTFSSIANDKGFSGAQTPWPFILADGRPHEQRTIRLDGTVFEFSPFELGSFDRTLNGFVPLRYAGSTFNNGQLDRSSCVRGYDNAGYVMATASTLFIGAYNVLEMQLDPSSFRVLGIFQLITNIAEGVLSTADRFDILDSVWEPNPFRGWEPSTNPVADEKNLHLVDAGLDRQNIPFHPHIFRDRRVDVVFSVDSSADTSFNWPDGSSAVATYRRSLMNTGDRTSFPVIPGQDTFLNEGLNTRPKRDSVVRNGWAVVTQLNSTRDRDWPSCVGCAILLRSFQRTGAPVPARCSKCFNNYCWNGRIDESKPAPYEPQVLNSTALDSWTI
ncbi:hypothetical protein CDD83_4536 [Cordyceps sp. RAO-2017]|nr:hypothetical protein CDD83_4536 [Cordyceps sp. RAO-2017]